MNSAGYKTHMSEAIARQAGIKNKLIEIHYGHMSKEFIDSRMTPDISVTARELVEMLHNASLRKSGFQLLPMWMMDNIDVFIKAIEN